MLSQQQRRKIWALCARDIKKLEFKVLAGYFMREINIFTTPK
jgi:hypothetical protein